MAPSRGRGNRGGFRGRGGNTRGGSTKLARSGIRTKSGYRKFDSQRVKEVESEDSEPEAENEIEQDINEESSEEDEEVETVSKGQAYSALLQSFHQRVQPEERKRKRRKIDVTEEPNGISEDEDVDQDAGVEVDDESEEDSSPDETVNDHTPASDEDDEDLEDTTDPYEVHFANKDDNELSRRLKSIKANEWRTEKHDVPKVGSFVVSAPKCVEGSIRRNPSVQGTGDLSLKKRLVDSATKHIGNFNHLEQEVVPYIFNYQDILLSNRTPQNARNLRNLSCLHAINHILKGRDRVLKNNARLSHSEDQDLDIRDQGFTRPKVLILLETRQMCAKYADCIVGLFAPEQQENKQRFKDSFEGRVEDRETMPEDYNELFDGNNDNNFLTAVKFTRKTLRFYSPFYTSDIILASPLGLRRVLENEDAKKRDHDFLSSIEIAIVDQADAMYMQNWENVETVFKHLNLQLKEAHGCDFNRVRPYYLDGNAKYLRQTIMFGAYITPEMNRLFNTTMLNIAGKAKFTADYTTNNAIDSIGGGLGIKQTFSRFSSSSPTVDPDARFQYFTTAVLPSLLRLPKPAPSPDGTVAQGIIIFIPSYYDFLRLRNFFATSTQTQNISFGAIHEYTSVSDQRRARSHFLSGRHSFLLYTQRAHHFYRLKLRGVKRVVCYGLPDNAMFYEEIVSRFLGTSLSEGRLAPEEGSVRAMFGKWDGLKLERVVGSGRVKGMLGGVGDTFEFL